MNYSQREAIHTSFSVARPVYYRSGSRCLVFKLD
jgi:hypothetical protein